MASFQKTASGWRAQIKLKGVRDSRVFPTKREAQAWAVARELEIKNETAGVLPDKTLGDTLDRYLAEVSPQHRGAKWEGDRIRAFKRGTLPVEKLVREVRPADIAAFREARLAKVKPASVLRDLRLLNSIFETARKDWNWVNENPCESVRKPSPPPHRERTLRWWEIKRLLREMGYRPRGGPVTTQSQSLAVCLLLALRTGMRSGELCSLTWSQVEERYVHLPLTKNGRARSVPLSRKAVRLVQRMRGWDENKVFGLTGRTRDTLFRRYRDRAGLSGFTFHDSRHTAATWMAKKVDIMTLCRIFGWSTTKQALVYVNPSPSELASLLD
jgi:integrase